MKKFWKNYKNTIILLGAIIIGAICGIIFKDDAKIVSPFGDIFINLMFVIIVPLIFFTITGAIVKMESPKRLGKIIIRVFIVFIIMSVVSALIGVGATYNTKLIDNKDTNNIMELMDDSSVLDTDINALERTVSLITVNDFNELLSKNNIIALLIVSIITGFAIRKSKEKGEPVKKIILAGSEIIIHMVKIIMYYAPIGLGCYIATLIGTYGDYIAVGFLKTFIIYTIVCVGMYFIVYSIYVLLAGGKRGFKAYWKNIIPSTITALATCSSAACIPINIETAKKIGVPKDIAETTVPLGTSFHKDGSVIGSVFKIMFLVYLFNTNPSILSIIGTSIIATLLITAIPVGGGTISEMMIISLMSFPASSLPLLTIIATIIDAPATVLNVTGDTVSSMIVARSIDGKKWLKNKHSKKHKRIVAT